MKLLNRILFCLASSVVLASSAQATPITIDLGTLINGSSPTATDVKPWLTATFTDITETNGAKAVRLVLTNNLINSTTKLATGEYVTDWLFNVNSTAKSLSATYVSGYKTAIYSYAQDSLNGGSEVKAGNFDIDFTGGTANRPAGNRFEGGMTSTYDFIATDLTASSFAVTSSAGYYSAADVQGIPGSLSGSIGTRNINNDSGSAAGKPTPVPEPTSLMLLSMGVVSLSAFGRRNKRKN